MSNVTLTVASAMFITAAAAGQEASQKTKWEYLIGTNCDIERQTCVVVPPPIASLSVAGELIPDPSDPKRLSLVTLGEQRWELVSVVISGSHVVMFFKRPI